MTTTYSSVGRDVWLQSHAWASRVAIGRQASAPKQKKEKNKNKKER